MLALTRARIFTVTNGIIEDGTIIVKDGKIDQVGKDVKIPKGIPVYDLAGKSITPGFIDAHCHVGVFNEGTGEIGNDGNDCSNPLAPHLKAADGIYTDDEAFRDALEHGVTTLCIGPGSANVIGGQMALVKPKSRILEEMLLADYIGLKCAFGENPKRVYEQKGIMPLTRMGVAAVLRKALQDALNYQAKKEHHDRDKPEEGKEKAPFETNYQHEVLLEVLDGKKPLRAHAHRSDDIQTAIRIAEEFGVRIVIEHCTEGHKIADYLAKKGVSVILGPINTSKPKVELRDATIETAKILEDAGVRFAVMTDAPINRIGDLLDNVRLCVRHGLTRETGLKAITIHPAQILGYEKRLGSIEPGKDADLAVFNGDPFDFMATVSASLIEGEVVYGKIE